MKTIRQNLKGWPGMIGTIGLLALMLSSCVKGNNNNVTVQQLASLAVIDASPDAPPLDFFLETTRVNSSAINYGGGLGYFSAYAGVRNAIFYADATLTKIASDSINLKVNHSYTLFLTNVVAHPDIILLNDSIPKPAANMAAVRFVNVSPDAGPVDFSLKGVGGSLSAVAGNISYKGSTAFLGVTAAVSDTIVVVKAGTTTVLATVPTVNLQSSGIYTVWLYGLANGTPAEKLTANIVLNTYSY